MRRYAATVHRHSRHGDEGGFAMIMTLIAMIIITTMLVAITAQNVQSLPLAKQSQNYQAALQAADAGAQDYVARLDANTAYYVVKTDARNPALTPTTDTGTGVVGNWAPVCPTGSSGNSCANTSVNEWYSYTVDASQAESKGIVTLTVTGAAGGDPAVAGSQYVVRTIKESVGLQSNGDWLYYTQYEHTDPNFVTGFSSPLGGTYSQNCDYDVWQLNTFVTGITGSAYYGPYEGNDLCSGYKINFGPDFLNGPIESQDEFNICGAPDFPYGASSTYNQAASASSSDGINPTYHVANASYGGPGVLWNNPGCTDAATFCTASNAGCTNNAQTPQPAGVAELSAPPTNSLLIHDLATSQDGGGCYYQGPIQVTLNQDGTMSVSLIGSPQAVATSPAGITSETSTSCVGSHIAFPSNGLIYDDNETTCGTSACAPDIFVSGVNAGGPITLASAANITITNNIQDADTSLTSADIVGLWAQSTILYPDSFSAIPNTNGTQTVLPAVTNLVVDAAMEAEDDSIYLPCHQYDAGQNVGGRAPSTTGCNDGSAQNVNTVSVAGSAGSPAVTSTCGGATLTNPTVNSVGGMGFLNICGSLAQDYRGIVGNTIGNAVSSGYDKNYNFDQRLKYLEPPFFASVTNPNWTPTTFTECNPTTNPAVANAAGC